MTKAAKKDPKWLLKYARNVYSQEGEDGIIKKILEILPKKDKWCVEFGAYDGEFLSNTKSLIEKDCYSAVLIECDKKRAKKLLASCSNNENVIVMNRFVGFSDDDNLDDILEETSIPLDFDFLSIDVDSIDYYIWKAMKNHRPKLVCIEFNPTIPTKLNFVQPPDPNINQGASLLSLVELGKSKGYELVSVTRFNAFFVRSEYYPLFNISDNSPEALRFFNPITYIFSGLDGSIILKGNLVLPWHGVRMKESKMQYLPRYLRKFPGGYSLFEKLMFALYLLFEDPKFFVERLKVFLSTGGKHPMEGAHKEYWSKNEF